MAEGLLVNNATSWKMSLLKTAPHKVSVMSLIVAKPGSIVKEADAIAGPAAPDSHGDAQPRPRYEVADIFRLYGAEFRRGHALTRGQLKVMRCVEACRTAEMGGHIEECGHCGLRRPVYNSCRNRHCPKCKKLATAEWLKARQDELLPVGYFHNVFTLPHELNPLTVPNPAPIAFWADCCRIGIRVRDVYYTENLVNTSPAIFYPAPRHPAPRILSYPASTPPLSPIRKMTIFVEAAGPWGSSDGFAAAPRIGWPLPSGSSKCPVRIAKSSAPSIATAPCTDSTSKTANKKPSAPDASFAAIATLALGAAGLSASTAPIKSDAWA